MTFPALLLVTNMANDLQCAVQERDAFYEQSLGIHSFLAVPVSVDEKFSELAGMNHFFAQLL